MTKIGVGMITMIAVAGGAVPLAIGDDKESLTSRLAHTNSPQSSPPLLAVATTSQDFQERGQTIASAINHSDREPSYGLTPFRYRLVKALARRPSTRQRQATKKNVASRKNARSLTQFAELLGGGVWC